MRKSDGLVWRGAGAIAGDVLDGGPEFGGVCRVGKRFYVIDPGVAIVFGYC